MIESRSEDGWGSPDDTPRAAFEISDALVLPEGCAVEASYEGGPYACVVLVCRRTRRFIGVSTRRLAHIEIPIFTYPVGGGKAVRLSVGDLQLAVTEASALLAAEAAGWVATNGRIPRGHGDLCAFTGEDLPSLPEGYSWGTFVWSSRRRMKPTLGLNKRGKSFSWASCSDTPGKVSTTLREAVAKLTQAAEKDANLQNALRAATNNQ